MLHPELGEGESLTVGESDGPPLLTDRKGTVLDIKAHPSLSAVTPQLRDRYGDRAGGSPGITVQIIDAAGQLGSTLHTLTSGKPGKLRTTLDATVQKAAEKAVGQHSQASVAVVKPSTGEILAFANNRRDEFNAAFDGKLAPGSTMKVITAAMLLDKRLVTADQTVRCPKYATSGGRRFHNMKMFSIDGGSFAESFARSCNTAFVTFADELGNGDLTATARHYFGLGGDDWKAGVTTFDGSVPTATGAHKAAALIGQGPLQMNPLTMASVAATAQHGNFKQPILIPVNLDGRKLATARPLQRSVAQQLRKMMHRAATNGTATRIMQGISGNIGAKTGTAETDSQTGANSWFLGYRNDMAAVAVVEDGGHGSDAAGPIVADILNTGK